MITVGAMLLKPLYGTAFTDALVAAGAALNNLIKKSAHTSIPIPAVLKIITTRVTQLCDARQLDPRQMVAGVDDIRPLANRIADALTFTDVDSAFTAALRAADKAANRQDVQDALAKDRKERRLNPDHSGGGGGGGGGRGRGRGRGDNPGGRGNRNGRDDRGSRKGPRAPPDFDNAAWRAAMPTDLPNDWVRPCFFYACGEGTCKNKKDCQQPYPRSHNDWAKGLSADLKARTKAWMKTHWVFAPANDTA